MIINRSDCISNFQFEGNVNNSVVSGTNGTVTGTEQYKSSISGKAFDFDGSNRVGVGNGSLSNSSNLTIFLKMNMDTLPTGGVIFSKKTSGTANGFLFNVTVSATNELRFRVRTASGSAWVDTVLFFE